MIPPTTAARIGARTPLEVPKKATTEFLGTKTSIRPISAKTAKKKGRTDKKLLVETLTADFVFLESLIQDDAKAIAASATSIKSKMFTMSLAPTVQGYRPRNTSWHAYAYFVSLFFFVPYFIIFLLQDNVEYVADDNDGDCDHGHKNGQ